ncbi:MAG: hypothetical protein ACT4RN_08190 [Pseudonocardia sp.]
MPAVAVVTLALAAVVIALVAVALFRVILHLRHVHFTLGSVVVGVRAIAHQTRTVPEVIPSVNANLAPVRAWTETV